MNNSKNNSYNIINNSTNNIDKRFLEKKKTEKKSFCLTPTLLFGTVSYNFYCCTWYHIFFNFSLYLFFVYVCQGRGFLCLHGTQVPIFILYRSHLRAELIHAVCNENSGPRSKRDTAPYLSTRSKLEKSVYKIMALT